jgi:hypothetical protein
MDRILLISQEARARAAVTGRETLAARSTRPPDFKRENRALMVMVEELSQSPAGILQKLSEEILILLDAGSAGVSLFKDSADGAPETFCWAALAGQWAPFVGGEMPRDASPCGVVVDANDLLLFENPKDIFPAAGLLEPPITEILLAPFRVDGRPAGTVWALHHDRALAFDKEDARLLSSMAHFASSAHQAASGNAARHDMQARLESLTEAMPNHAWTAGLDGMLDWFNSRVYEYSGAKAPDLDGQGWASLVHPHDIEAAAARWREALATGAVYETQFRLRSASGTYRWHLARAVPVRNGAGAIVRWVGTNTDIEDQKKTAQTAEDLNAVLEERVRERTAKLLKAEASLRQSQKMEAVGQLTGGIAHDFNNMLAVVIGALNLIERRQSKGEPFGEMIAAAHDGAQRAAELTNRLLAFSRQLPLNPQIIDAGGMVKSMSELLRRTLGEEVRLETVLAGGLWETNTDINQLENAIINLSVNARDAMPNGGRLTIETSNAHLDDEYARAHDEVIAGQYVLIAVSDEGTGMTPETIEKVFEPFFTTKPVGKGTGLGLSQVFGFVKQSRGHIKIYSEMGQGTTAKMYLPRAFPVAGRGEAAQRPSPTPAGSLNEVILLVEDDDRMREITVAGLRELGYTVLHSSSGARALQMLAERPQVSLLFTDIVMPDMGGRQLADAALKMRPDLKILFTTGYTRNAVVHNGVLDPGVNFLSKPFTLNQLGKKVRDVLS